MKVLRKGGAKETKEAIVSHVLRFVAGKWAAGTVALVIILSMAYSLQPPSLSYSHTIPRNWIICPLRVRVGGDGDGGKYMCGKSTVPKKNCVVYSFGIRDDFTFDHDLAERGCDVHGFDPSPGGLESKAKYEVHPNAIYHSYGLGSLDKTYQPTEVPFRWPGMDYLRQSNTMTWQLKRIPTIMKENNHDKLTILKVDVEGTEWDTMMDIINTDWEELYIEIHFPPTEYRLSRTFFGGLTIERAPNSQASHENRPALNVSGPIDRIGMLKALNEVGVLYYWEPNGFECAELAFRRKESANGKTIDKFPPAPSPSDAIE